MELSLARPSRSITTPPTGEPIADFVVISGPNGSGKSNLLQAITEGAILVDGVEVPGSFPAPGIRHFALAQLMVTADGAQMRASFRDRHVQLFQQLDMLRSSLSSFPNNLTGDVLDDTLRTQMINQRQISDRALRRLEQETGKRLSQLDIEDFRLHAGLLVGIRDPFTLSVTELFLAYHDRFLRNKFERWLTESEGETLYRPMSDQSFIATFGPAPWSLLDDTLALMKLDYSFIPPSGTEETRPFEAELLHRPSGIVVKMAELSSGEKALLAIAMSLYSDSRWGEAMEIPRVLLLDEADASLHPSMVRSLLAIVGEVFNRRLGVKVLMTTHSPTTVALAPEDSLYVMRRNEEPRLVKATRDHALSSLTVGLPTLSVTNENRRQVFVESEYDEACYQELFSLVRPSLNTPLSLVFIAAGKGESGGAGAVNHLVSTLRASGNLSVYGIVDRDNRSDSRDGVKFNGTRHSIENVALDPLALAVYLLRSGWVSSGDVGIDGNTRHFELRERHAQDLVDFMAGRVLGASEMSERSQVAYAGGFTVLVPSLWLNLQGHELEERVKDVFPQLKRLQKNLKLDVIAKAMRDVGEFVPSDAIELFRQLVVT